MPQSVLFGLVELMLCMEYTFLILTSLKFYGLWDQTNCCFWQCIETLMESSELLFLACHRDPYGSGKLLFLVSHRHPYETIQNALTGDPQ